MLGMAITILADLDGTLLPRPYNVQQDGSTETETATATETTTNNSSSNEQPDNTCTSTCNAPPCSSSRPTHAHAHARAMPRVVHPNLSEGPAYGPLVRLLDLGATVVGITGSRLSTHRRRFFDELPVRHRRDGRVLLAVQTGARLHGGHPDDGRAVRDAAFDAHLLSVSGGTASTSTSTRFRLDDATVHELVGVGRRGLVRFYADLADDPTLVDGEGPLGYLLDIAARLKVPKAGKKTTAPKDGSIDIGIVHDMHIPITDNVHDVPRIEVRENNSAVVFVGVPSSLGNAYFAVPDHLRSAVDGRPTGRSCYDCVPAGMDKSHVVRYLLGTNVVRWGRTVAIGDQPAGNDAGLTLWHGGGSRAPVEDNVGSACSDGSSSSSDNSSSSSVDEEKKGEEETTERQSHAACIDIPFISVSECPTMVPRRLKDCHVSEITNAEGSAKVLMELADVLEGRRGNEDERATLQHAAEGSTGSRRISFCTNTVKGIVRKVNDDASASK